MNTKDSPISLTNIQMEYLASINELDRRHYLASIATGPMGVGVRALCKCLKVSKNTIYKGIFELNNKILPGRGRIRKPGGGARRSNIMLQFLTESVVLSLTGGLLGILFGLGIYALAAAIIEQLPFALNVGAILISFAVCTAVGLFFGWYPARRAADLDPIQALRYE